MPRVKPEDVAIPAEVCEELARLAAKMLVAAARRRLREQARALEDTAPGEG